MDQKTIQTYNLMVKEYDDEIIYPAYTFALAAAVAIAALAVFSIFKNRFESSRIYAS